MNESMKTQETVETNGKSERKPWKIQKGQCQDVAIYRYETGGRTVYQVLIPGAKAPDNTRFTTTNKKNALATATTLANAPAKLGPILAGVSPALLEKAAESILKLEPVLDPLGMSVPAGLEEYANLKARTGKLVLPDLVDGILAGAGPAVTEIGLETLLREVAAAIAKLVPVLGPLNISLASGIEEYAAVKAKAGSQDLRELLKQVLEKPWIEKSKTPVVEVLVEFLKFKKDEQQVSDEYYKGLYYMLNFVVERLESGIAIGAVTTEMLRDIIFRPEVGPWSKRTYRTNVRTFFKWCQHHQFLDYAEPTAADRLAKIRLPEPAPRIFTVQEAKSLLTALEDPWCLLFLVLTLFTGIRHDELQEFTFDLIKPGEVVDITAEISKTGKRRLIPMQPVLDAWLAPFYGRTGLVMPIANIQAKVLNFIRKAGLPDLPPGWSRNWLRQSYCSYRLAQTGKVVETAAEDGHRAYILETVYLYLSTAEAAEAYFSLTPEACGKPDWAERMKAFLADAPEIYARPKNKSRGWKPIGGRPDMTAAPELPCAA